MAVIKEYTIIRVEENTFDSLQDAVIVEFALSLKVNGRDHTQFLCTPSDLKELVYGHLFAEGIIYTKADVAQLTIEGKQAAAHVVPGKRRCSDRFPVLLKPQDLFSAVEGFNRQSPLFRKTGGVHSCALYHGSDEPVFAEDIGRSNAVDKVLGRALLAGIDTGSSYLITSGRISGQMVRKALRSGVPILISQAAPTDQAVELARRGHLTLCGFARGRRLNIYSAPERISL